MNIQYIRHLVQLVGQMAASDLKKRYAASYLGLVWAVAAPLLTSVAYILVFGVFMSQGLPGRRYSGADFLPFYMLGFAPWTIFSDVMSRSANLVRENSNLITKVKFPHAILPLQILLSGFIPFGVILCIGLAALLYKGALHWTGQLHYQMLGLLCVLLITTGLSWLTAALAVYIPDLGQLVSVLLTFWFFSTPILYPADLFEGRAGIMHFIVIEANPFTTAIDLIRAPFFGIAVHASPEMVQLVLISVLFFFAGLFCYVRLSKGFADVL